MNRRSINSSSAILPSVNDILKETISDDLKQNTLNALKQSTYAKLRYSTDSLQQRQQQQQQHLKKIITITKSPLVTINGHFENDYNSFNVEKQRRLHQQPSTLAHDGHERDDVVDCDLLLDQLVISAKTTSNNKCLKEFNQLDLQRLQNKHNEHISMFNKFNPIAKPPQPPLPPTIQTVTATIQQPLIKQKENNEPPVKQPPSALTLEDDRRLIEKLNKEQEAIEVELVRYVAEYQKVYLANSSGNGCLSESFRELLERTMSTIELNKTTRKDQLRLLIKLANYGSAQELLLSQRVYIQTVQKNLELIKQNLSENVQKEQIRRKQAEQEELEKKKRREKEEEERRQAAAEAIELNKAKQRQEQEEIERKRLIEQQRVRDEEEERTAKAIERVEKAKETVAVRQGISEHAFSKQKYLNELLTGLRSDCDKIFNENPQMKTYKFDLQKSINFPLNSLLITPPDTDDQQQSHQQRQQQTIENKRNFYDKIKTIIRLLNGHTCVITSTLTVNPTKHPKAIDFCMEYLASKIIAKGEESVASRPDTAFQYAQLCVLLIKEFGKKFEDLLLAEFYEKCPFTIPFYKRKDKTQSIEDYLRSMGYKIDINDKVEEDEYYYKRMNGMLMLYFTLLLYENDETTNANDKIEYKNGIDIAWTWLADVLNMKPCTNSTAIMLTIFLKCCGNKFQQYYGQYQFNKILNYIIDVYLPLIKQLDGECQNKANIGRLELLLNEYKKNGYFQEWKR